LSSFNVDLLSIIGLSIVPETINFFYNQFLNVHTALKFSSLFNIRLVGSNFKEERRKSESAFKKRICSSFTAVHDTVRITATSDVTF
jgi:hypothetical protein